MGMPSAKSGLKKDNASSKLVEFASLEILSLTLPTLQIAVDIPAANSWPAKLMHLWPLTHLGLPIQYVSPGLLIHLALTKKINAVVLMSKASCLQRRYGNTRHMLN